MMPRLVDETGHRHGRLEVLERAGTASNGHALWACRCDCGRLSVVSGSDLRAGKSRSCGCLHLETSRAWGRELGRRYGGLRRAA